MRTDVRSVFVDEGFVIDDLVYDGAQRNLLDPLCKLDGAKKSWQLAACEDTFGSKAHRTFSVDFVSSTAEGDGFMVAMTATRASPANDGCKICVNLESLWEHVNSTAVYQCHIKA